MNRISTDTETVSLRAQVMEVLVYLAGLQGQVATLESIHDDLWSGRVVSSGTIYNCIAELRQALSRDGSGIAYIETIPKKGYRLAPPVVPLPVIPANDHGHPSVAVVPLYNRSKDAEIEYLCDGISEEILYRLSNVGGLKVVSAAALEERDPDARVVGRRFGVRTVLLGSLQKSGDRLRLTFRLDNTSDGATIWSERYDQPMADLFELQDSVAQRVVGALSPALDLGASSTPVLEHAGTRSLEAFNAFLLGKHAESRSTMESYVEAIRYFGRAVELDPTFARAHYRLYLACYMKRRLYGEDRDALARARLAAANAKKHDYRPAVPWIHIERRLHRKSRPRTRELALEALDKIRHPDPEWGSFAYEQLSWILPASGYFKATLDFAEHMFDSPDRNFEDSDADEELPFYYAAVGRYESAIRLWSSEIQKDPARPLFRYNRSLLYARTGRFEYAKHDIDRLDDGVCAVMAQAFYHFWRGESERTMEFHERLLALPTTHPFNLMYTYSMIGDIDSAIEYYTESVNSVSASFIDFGPCRAMSRAKLPISLVHQLEQHPGFQSLLDQEGIDASWRKELMERVNDVADITGIRINPEDDVAIPYGDLPRVGAA